MDRLVEGEPAGRRPLTAAPALAVQFFLIPLAVVAATVLVYAGFRLLLVSDQRSAQEQLDEIRFGGSNRRWPAAYELSRRLGDPTAPVNDPGFASALVKALADSKGDDPRVRRYLALAIGRLRAPLPPDTVSVLSEALEDPDSETRISVMWALGSLGEASVAGKLQEIFQASDDPGIRKMAIYALGAIPGDVQMITLQAALNDPAPDVQWNAAIALARKGRRDGVPTLKQMLDRTYVEQRVKRTTRADEDVDPVGEVMIGSLRALAGLREPTVREPVAAVSRQDRSLRVRQAAIEALQVIGQG